MNQANEQWERPSEKGSGAGRVAGALAVVLLLAAVGAGVYWWWGLDRTGDVTVASNPDPSFASYEEMRSALEASPDHIPAQARALAANGTPEEIFELVRDRIQTFPSATGSFEDANRSIRWGINGTLRGAAGTPREKAETLAHLYRLAGHDAEVQIAPYTPDDANLTRLLQHRPNHTFAPARDADLATWRSHVRSTAPDGHITHEDLLDPRLETTRALASRLVDLGAGGPGRAFDGDWTGGLPVVTVDVDDRTYAASPSTPWLGFDALPGNLSIEDLIPANPPGPPLRVHVRLSGLTDLAPSEPRVLVEGNWTADEVVGRQIRVSTPPVGDPKRVMAGSLGDVRAFEPMLGIQGQARGDGARIGQLFQGDPIDLTGKPLPVERLGRLVDAGLVEVPGERGANAPPIASLEIDGRVANASYPTISVPLEVTGADGGSVQGLRAGDLQVLEDGREVGFQLDNQAELMEVIFLVDTSGSVPDAWTGENQTRFVEQLTDAIQEARPGAVIRVKETGSGTWHWHAWASRQNPALIIYLTDGGSVFNFKDEGDEAAIASGPPSLLLNVTSTPSYGDTLRKTAELNGGAVKKASTPQAGLEAVLDYLDEQGVASYKAIYTSPKQGAKERTVEVRTADGAHRATAGYTPPPPGVENRSSPERLIGLQLTVTVGDKAVTRTLAGLGPHTRPAFEAGERTSAELHNETVAALLGSTVIHLEGAGPPLAVRLGDDLDRRASLADVYAALNGTDAPNKRVERAIEVSGQVRLLPPEVLTLASPLPGRYDPGTAPTYPTGLRTILFHSRPVPATGDRFERIDLLPLADHRTADEDAEQAYRMNVNRTAFLPVLESELFERSTVTALASEELVRWRGRDVGWDALTPLQQDVWRGFEDQRPADRGDLFFPKDGEPLAFYHVERGSGDPGEVHAMLSGVGDGGASRNPIYENLDRIETVLDMMGLASDVSEYSTERVEDTVGYGATLASKYAVAAILIAPLDAYEYDAETRERLFDKACQALEKAVDLGGLTVQDHIQITEKKRVDHTLAILTAGEPRGCPA